MSDHISGQAGKNNPLFTPEDLELFRSIRSDLSVNGRNLVDLLLKVFGTENSPTDLPGIIQNLGSSGPGAMNLLYAVYALMNGSYEQK